MDDLSAQRTLVKSPPELWAEISDLDSLTRHLDQFGEIRITQVEPEKTVAWEGERIRGTVHLEPSGWGTKVTLAAELVAVETVDTDVDPAQVEEPEAEPAAVERPGFFARLFRRRPAVPAIVDEIPEPEPEPEPEPDPEPTLDGEGAQAILVGVLDDLGAAHHRPFSRG